MAIQTTLDVLLARLRRGVVEAPQQVVIDRKWKEPQPESEFVKGMTLSAVRWSGRLDYVGLSMAVSDGPVNYRRVFVSEHEGQRHIVFIRGNRQHGMLLIRVMKLRDREKVNVKSSIIFNFLRGYPPCAELKKLSQVCWSERSQAVVSVPQRRR